MRLTANKTNKTKLIFFISVFQNPSDQCKFAIILIVLFAKNKEKK